MKIKRFNNISEDKQEEKMFTSSTREIRKYPDVKKLVRDDIKKHAKAYEILSK